MCDLETILDIIPVLGYIVHYGMKKVLGNEIIYDLEIKSRMSAISIKISKVTNFIFDIKKLL